VSAEVQADRYRAVRPIASGGMGRVVLAEDQLLARKVALKRLHTGGDERELVRLRREAQVGASLSHPNLVAVHDVFFDDHDLVVVMEYVEGETLRDAMRRGPLTPAHALQVLGAMAAALDHIHERGVIHRDVKPANVLLRSDGVVKLGDLGVASAQNRTRITTSGTVLGTVGYMAPEQLEGHPASPQVDIYALAAVAFEALSGRRARPETNPLALARAIAMEPPPDILTAWPEAPPEAAAVLRRGMASRPQDRPQTAGELMRRLEAAIEPEAVDPTVTSAGPVLQEDAPGSAPAGSAPRSPRSTPQRIGERGSARLPAGAGALRAAASAAAAAGAESEAGAAAAPRAAAESSSAQAVRTPPSPRSEPSRRVPPAPGDGGAAQSQAPTPSRGREARPPAPTAAQAALRRGPTASASRGAEAAVVAPALASGEPSAGRPLAPRSPNAAAVPPRGLGPSDRGDGDRSSAAAGTASPVNPESDPARARRRWPALAAIAALLAAGAITAVVLASGTGTHSPAHPAAPAASGAPAHAGQQSAPGGGSASAGGTSTAPRAGTATGGSQTTGLVPASGTGGSGDPVSAVKSFYGLAARHEYSASWALADPSMRAQLIGYSSFSRQQSAVRSITFNRASVISNSGSQATVSLATTPVLNKGTQHCQGTAQLIKATRGWMMDHISINCL